jgi:hypothetical protein
VAKAHNPSYLGGGDWEDCISRPAWAKSPQDPISINKKLHMVTYACHSSYMEDVNMKISVQVSPSITIRPNVKNNEGKKGLGLWFKW